VHDAVRPASKLCVVFLHDDVRFLPIALLEIADAVPMGIDASSRAGFIVRRLTDEIAAVDRQHGARDEARRR
jgi:hypothetical protein